VLDNKSFKAHSLTETGAMPVARGNVAFDLSALSTSLAKRTGADEYASDPLPSAGGGSARSTSLAKRTGADEYVSEPLSPAGGGSADAPTLPPPAAPALPAAADGGSEGAPDAETYINTLESQVAGLQDALDDANANWAAVAKERDALREKAHALWKKKVHAQILEKLIMGLVKEPNAEWVQTGLAEYMRGREKRGLRDDLSTERAESSSSSGSEPIDDGQDAVPVPPPQPAPPAYVVDDLDEPMDAPQGDDLEKRLKDLICEAKTMKPSLKEVDLYPQFEDMYRKVLSAEKALRDNRVNAYPELVSSLESMTEEAADELEEQLKVNARAGLQPNGDIVKRRRGKARR